MITHMNKKDMILLTVLLVSAFALLLVTRHGPAGEEAYVYVGGKLYGVYDLSQPQSVRIVNDNGLINDIEISDNSIFMRDATCPGKQCVNSGRISRNNETICCAPAGILIIIRSETDGGYDAITN